LDPVALYLDLIKRVLTRTGFENPTLDPLDPWSRSYRKLRAKNWVRHLLEPIQKFLGRRGYELVQKGATDRVSRQQIREQGCDWPATAETMIGLKRLDNLQHCIETALADDVPGDLIETGVWRGGATIFMRAVLAAHQVTDRTVWVADSFRGLPEPDLGRYPADEGDIHWTFEELAVSADEVRANFERYRLLDDQVRFLEGWFADTLVTAPIERLAVLRLDGDMYGSTWDSISALYPKLSLGGFVIVDDYFAVEGCQRAIEDYRERVGITDPIEQIDWGGAFWRRR
jgi:O-methyltransferase